MRKILNYLKEELFILADCSIYYTSSFIYMVLGAVFLLYNPESGGEAIILLGLGMALGYDKGRARGYVLAKWEEEQKVKDEH